MLTFGEELRPVKLTTIVKVPLSSAGRPQRARVSLGQTSGSAPQGYRMPSTDFLFERRLNEHLHQTIRDHCAHKPSMVFCRRADLVPARGPPLARPLTTRLRCCSSRKGASDAALHLKNVASESLIPLHPANRQALTAAAAKVVNKQLQQVLHAPAQAAQVCHTACSWLTWPAGAVCTSTCKRDMDRLPCVQLLPAGFAFHHAALEPADRSTVEELFRARKIAVRP